MASCSEPPTAEHDQAIASLAAARTAGAATYAADDFAAAQDFLKRYDEFVAQRDYKQALNAALNARDRGFDAAKASATKQQALRDDAAKQIAVIELDLKAAEAALTVAPRSAARRSEKLRQTRKATTAAMQEARTLLGNGELTKAGKKLADASAALKRDIAAMQAPAAKAKK